MLEPGHTIWKAANAPRAALLIDGARYFGALRAALLKAQSRVFIIGWDIHSRTPFVGESGRADDGYPETLGEFLSALVRDKPRLKIGVLLWDFAMLYATEREFMPTYALQWSTPSNVDFCLDNAIPIGSSQHQKIVVIDDSVAFSGGLDLTMRRWDTGAHRVNDPHRRDPRGKPYRPFHDVQAIVEGAAAQALGELARWRWRNACGQDVAPVEGGADRWPDHIKADFSDINVGVARTQPAYNGDAAVHEVAALFSQAIEQAEQTIYVENQFLSSISIAKALAKRLRERPWLELLMIGPARHDSWLEAHSMRNGRIRFMSAFDDDDLRSRVRLMHPQVSERGQTVETMVHSKIMAIDDRYLRVGSANLNNRSMGTDSECDLIFEAANDEHRGAITELRNRLLGDHCGASSREVASALSSSGSLLATAGSLACNGHRLHRIDDGVPDNVDLASYIEDVADPERPIGAEEFVSAMSGGIVPHATVPNVLKAIAIGLAVLAAALVWEYSPLASLVNLKAVGAALRAFSGGPWAPVVVIGAFVGGGLVMFPVTVLIAATAATFGPWLGLLYAGAGAFFSALVTYGLGARLGRKTLRELMGPKLNRIRNRIARKGIIAIAAIRMVPFAPFTLVNLVAGASEIGLSQYLIGTMLGMLPGIFVLSVLGHQLSEIILHPSAAALGLLALAVFGWIGMSIAIQALVAKYWDQ